MKCNVKFHIFRTAILSGIQRYTEFWLLLLMLVPHCLDFFCFVLRTQGVSPATLFFWKSILIVFFFHHFFTSYVYIVKYVKVWCLLHILRWACGFDHYIITMAYTLIFICYINLAFLGYIHFWQSLKSCVCCWNPFASILMRMFLYMSKKETIFIFFQYLHLASGSYNTGFIAWVRKHFFHSFIFGCLWSIYNYYLIFSRILQ